MNVGAFLRKKTLMLRASFRSLTGINTLREVEEAEKSWLHCFVVHKAFIIVVPFRGEDGR